MLTSLVLQASKKNLFEVARTLPRHGVGAQLRRTSWPEDSFWTLHTVKPSEDGKHGKATGVFTWKGVQQGEEPVRVRGVLKRVWRAAQPQGNPLGWHPLPKPPLTAPPGAAADQPTAPAAEQTASA